MKLFFVKYLLPILMVGAATSLTNCSDLEQSSSRTSNQPPNQDSSFNGINGDINDSEAVANTADDNQKRLTGGSSGPQEDQEPILPGDLDEEPILPGDLDEEPILPGDLDEDPNPPGVIAGDDLVEDTSKDTVPPIISDPVAQNALTNTSVNCDDSGLKAHIQSGNKQYKVTMSALCASINISCQLIADTEKYALVFESQTESNKQKSSVGSHSQEACSELAKTTTALIKKS